jgi:hypothetical protein
VASIPLRFQSLDAGGDGCRRRAPFHNYPLIEQENRERGLVGIESPGRGSECGADTANTDDVRDISFVPRYVCWNAIETAKYVTFLLFAYACVVKYMLQNAVEVIHDQSVSQHIHMVGK